MGGPTRLMSSQRWRGRPVQSHLRILFGTIALLSALSGQVYVMAVPPQSAPDSAGLQVFLSAVGKGDSPAVLHEPELSVHIDKAVAQVKALRSAKDEPLLFAVLVDTSKSDAAAADLVKEAAFQLFERLASAPNQGYLVLFNHRVAVSRDPIPASQAKEALGATIFEGGTAVYDAIEQTCKQKLSRLGNPAKPRRVILLISDGEDNSSHVTHIRAEEAALEEGVSVFSLVTKSPLGGPRGENFLKEISRRTGGLSTDKDLKKDVPLVVAGIEAQWMITLTPTQPADKKLHSMQTKYMQKEVHIYAPSDVLLE